MSKYSQWLVLEELKDVMNFTKIILNMVRRSRKVGKVK